MYYRESETIFKQVCLHQANTVSNAMLAENRVASMDELIDCYSWIVEGINEFTWEDVARVVEQWFSGVFRSAFGESQTVKTLLLIFLEKDKGHELLFEQNGVYRHNPAFDVSRMARA